MISRASRSLVISSRSPAIWRDEKRDKNANFVLLFTQPCSLSPNLLDTSMMSQRHDWSILIVNLVSNGPSTCSTIVESTIVGWFRDKKYLDCIFIPWKGWKSLWYWYFFSTYSLCRIPIPSWKKTLRTRRDATIHEDTQHTTTNNSSPAHHAIDLWSSTTNCLSDKRQAAVHIGLSLAIQMRRRRQIVTHVEDAHWQHFLGVRRLIRIDYGGTSVSWSSCVDFHPSWRDKIWRSRVKKSKNQFYPMRSCEEG